jgi:uncharacterized membrane protein (UPF0136 family)
VLPDAAARHAVGGIMGFAKRGSSKSLGGGLSGALVLALAARSMSGPGAAAGAQVAFGEWVRVYACVCVYVKMAHELQQYTHT